MNPITAWLDALKSPLALRLCDPDEPASALLASSLADAIEHSAYPIGKELEALLYLRIGQMEPAHGNVQDATRGLGAYIHGVLHRMEGDYWNAKYWFDRVRDPSLLNGIQRHMSQMADANHQAKAVWTGPRDFVDACQASRSESTPELLQLASWEWQTLWLIANEKNPR